MRKLREHLGAYMHVRFSDNRLMNLAHPSLDPASSNREVPQISDDLVYRFEQDGAVILRNVIAFEWIERLRAAIDGVLQSPGQFASDDAAADKTGRFYGDFFLWRSNPVIRSFLFDSPLAEIAARMMRSSTVKFFYEQLLVKEPSTMAPTPWHQDLPYWPMSGWQIASVWVPVDRATPETGVVSYVKGSHTWGKLYRPRSFKQNAARPNYDNSELQDAPDIDASPQHYEFVTGILEPGDVFVHHARTLHGAPGNASTTARRRALATRWLGDDARFENRPNHFLKGEKFQSLASLMPATPDGDLKGSELFPQILPRIEARQ